MTTLEDSLFKVVVGGGWMGEREGHAEHRPNLSVPPDLPKTAKDGGKK